MLYPSCFQDMKPLRSSTSKLRQAVSAPRLPGGEALGPPQLLQDALLPALHGHGQRMLPADDLHEEASQPGPLQRGLHHSSVARGDHQHLCPRLKQARSVSQVEAMSIDSRSTSMHFRTESGPNPERFAPSSASRSRPRRRPAAHRASEHLQRRAR